jgi:hypothetical protein
MGLRVTETDPLAIPVYGADGYKPFGQFTIADARERSQELSAVAGWGPTARVAGVAHAWSELAQAMSGAGAERVAELDAESTAAFARRLWVVPPGGSLLR